MSEFLWAHGSRCALSILYQLHVAAHCPVSTRMAPCLACVLPQYRFLVLRATCEMQALLLNRVGGVRQRELQGDGARPPRPPRHGFCATSTNCKSLTLALQKQENPLHPKKQGLARRPGSGANALQEVLPAGHALRHRPELLTRLLGSSKEKNDERAAPM